jgi:hypothetical protein
MKGIEIAANLGPLSAYLFVSLSASLQQSKAK